MVNCLKETNGIKVSHKGASKGSGIGYVAHMFNGYLIKSNCGSAQHTLKVHPHLRPRNLSNLQKSKVAVHKC